MRTVCLMAAVLVGASLHSDAVAAQDMLLEGFENIAKVKVTGGKISAAAAGSGGVTEGKQAASIPSGASLVFTISANNCRRYEWLKFDTLTLQPLAHRFLIEATGKKLSFARYCYAESGKDTLALPLSWLVTKLRGRWPGGNLRIVLTSAADAGVIVDNIRLTSADAPPEDCVLQDFGGDKQLVWPGFERGGTESEHVVWSGEGDIRAYADRDFPDPLCADFVGPRLRPGSTKDSFSLICPKRSGKAWLWVTHFTGRGPPAEYAVKFRAKTVLRTRRSQKQMLSSKGLFEGMDGDWTPKWYDKTYAGRFSDIVKVSLVAGRNRIDLGNSQLAALAMTSGPGAAELARYVDKVQADLSRFRRQFIVGAKISPRCELPATPAEQKAGIMIFSPPLDDALSPGWRPSEGHRAKVIRAVVANGDSIMIPISVAPLKATNFLNVTLSGLRTDNGRELSVGRKRTRTWFCRRIPRVLDAAAQFQPWIPARKSGRLAERELVCILVTISPPAAAAGGTYKGTLKLDLAGGRAQVPLEVRVVDMGPQATDRPTVGAVRTDGRAPWFYLSLCDGLPEAARDALGGRVQRQLLSDVLNALRLPAAGLTTRLAVSDTTLRGDLKAYPARLATGPTVFNLEGAFWRLDKRGVKPGTRRYQTAVTAAVKKTDMLARRAGLRWFCFYVGSGYTAKELADLSKRASSVRSAGGSATAWAYVKAIRKTPEKDRRRVLVPFASLIFVPNGPDLAKSIALFKSLGRDKGAYVYLTRPGRYGAGLFAAASGADGVFCAGVAPGRPLYNGFGFNGRGVLALQPDKSLAPTLAMFALRQGVRDFLLVKRCEALLARAEKAKVAAFGLDNDLAELRVRVARDVGPGFDRRLTRSANMAPSEIQAWRVRLILEAGKTAQRLKAK